MKPEQYREQIREMEIGETIVPLQGFHLKRKNRYDFVLFQDSNKFRARWGTREEIISDLDTCHLTGMLPKQDMPSW